LLKTELAVNIPVYFIWKITENFLLHTLYLSTKFMSEAFPLFQNVIQLKK